MNPVAILASGMVTSVGFDSASSCAAMRVGITGFVETRFMFGGEWLIGSPVPFAESLRGREKLLRMLVLALGECLAAAGGVATARRSRASTAVSDGRADDWSITVDSFSFPNDKPNSMYPARP